MHEESEDLRFREGTCRELHPSLLQDAEGRLIGLVGQLLLTARLRDLVAKRRLPGVNAFFEFPPHPLHGPCGAHVVVELREPGEDGLEESSFGLRIDGFGDRYDADAVLHERGLDVEVVSYVACEPVHLPDEQLFDAMFLALAECKHLDQLRTVRKFGRFATIHKYLDHLKMIAPRVFAA